MLNLKKTLTKVLEQIYKDKSYHTADIVSVARNYLAGYIGSDGKLFVTVPLSKPCPSTAAVTSVTVSTLHVYQPSANTVNLQSYVNTANGYMRTNSVDIEITFTNAPSSLSTSKMCTVDFRGSITI